MARDVESFDEALRIAQDISGGPFVESVVFIDDSRYGVVKIWSSTTPDVARRFAVQAPSKTSEGRPSEALIDEVEAGYRQFGVTYEVDAKLAPAARWVSQAAVTTSFREALAVARRITGPYAAVAITVRRSADFGYVIWDSSSPDHASIVNFSET